MLITIAGLGYVGLSLAMLLSQNHTVMGFDINEKRINLFKNKKFPILDKEIQENLTSKKLNLYFTTNPKLAFQNSDFLIIATPTNFNPKSNCFDTSSIESVIETFLPLNNKALIVIKSTVPVGYTLRLRKKYNYNNIIFSPEFLREDKALYDNMYPSRIIVGDYSEQAKAFGNLLKEVSLREFVPILHVHSSEAEAIKLFSNTYLAMRVAFFNELDTYAELSNLNSKHIIEGVSLDPRIGNNYNNPSFGYGGYCLPKDTKQLLADFQGIPQNMISAIVNANRTRKDHIAKMILKRKPKVVGIYRLISKSDSDNFRYSAIQGIMKRIKTMGIDVVIFEPLLYEEFFYESKVYKDLKMFKEISDIIISNRAYIELDDVKYKTYSRDLFNNN